jgi:hypothetical protein
MITFRVKLISFSSYAMLEGFISLWVMILSLIHLGNPTIENDLHMNKVLFNPRIKNDLKRKKLDFNVVLLLYVFLFYYIKIKDIVSENLS